MSIFVDYLSNPFSNLKNTPQIIIMTSTNSLWIQSLIVTNTGEEDIRINLKFMRNITDPLGNVGIFLAKNFLIPSYKTISSQKEPVLYNTSLPVVLLYNNSPASFASVGILLICSVVA